MTQILNTLPDNQIKNKSHVMNWRTHQDESIVNFGGSVLSNTIDYLR